MKRRIGLQTKSIISVSVLMMLMTGALSCFFISYEKDRIQEDMRERGLSLAKNLAYNAQYSTLIVNKEMLTNLLNGVMKERSVTYGLIQDLKGKTLSEVGDKINRPDIDRRALTTNSPLIQHYLGAKMQPLYELSIPIETTPLKQANASEALLFEIRQKSEKIGVARIGFSLAEANRQIRRITATIISLSLLITLLGILITILLVRRIIQPVKELVKGTQIIASGNLAHQVKVASKNEIGELAASFNQMSNYLKESQERMKQANDQLLQAEKLSALGGLIAGVAHELNNPLTSVILFSEMLLEQQEVKPELYDDLKVINSEATRASKIVRNLLTFARKHRPEQEYIQINKIIESTLELKNYQLRVDNIEVIKTLDKNLPQTMADPHQLQQVFFNLINNAQQAMSHLKTQKQLRISSYVQEDRIKIEVKDNGLGIHPEHLKRIFDPFFTTKASGEGTGLGLSISYGIIQEHGGQIIAYSQINEGTTMTIDLPIKEEVTPSNIQSGCSNSR